MTEHLLLIHDDTSSRTLATDTVELLRDHPADTVVWISVRNAPMVADHALALIQNRCRDSVVVWPGREEVRFNAAPHLFDPEVYR